MSWPLAHPYLMQSSLGGTWFLQFCLRRLRINDMIKSSASAAPWMIKMQGSALTMARLGRRAGAQSPAFVVIVDAALAVDLIMAAPHWFKIVKKCYNNVIPYLG